MITRSNLFLVVVVVFVAILLSLAVRYSLHARRTSRDSWEGLLGRLSKVNRDNIALVALDLVDEDGTPRESEWPELDPEQIWRLIGGMEGLEILGSNCEVLVDLAFYMQQWYPEALVVAEDLRRNAREVGWHIERLKGAAKTGNLHSSFPTYAQRAVASYYLMTRHLLSLYQAAQSPKLFDLQAAL